MVGFRGVWMVLGLAACSAGVPGNGASGGAGGAISGAGSSGAGTGSGATSGGAETTPADPGAGEVGDGEGSTTAVDPGPSEGGAETAAESTTGPGGDTSNESTTGTGGDESTVSTAGPSTGDPTTDGGDVDVPETCPEPPGSLARWMTGGAQDARVRPTGPGLILMGGNFDTDEAFEWWRSYLAGGDVVVLRVSGSDGYNDYLYESIGGVDSVETLRVDSSSLAEHPYVACRIRQAEGVFIAGGDQADYMEQWKGTELASAVDDVYRRGGIVGGTSAGLAVLGRWAYAAYSLSVYSSEMLADPYNPYATLDDGLFDFPLVARVVTDSHFAQRDRMGRLLGFVARIVEDGWGDPVLGIGVDEDTSLVVEPNGEGKVLGPGRVYVIRSNGRPGQCEAGAPLVYQDLSLYVLEEGDRISLPAGSTSVPARPLGAVNGQLVPPDPY